MIITQQIYIHNNGQIHKNDRNNVLAGNTGKIKSKGYKMIDRVGRWDIQNGTWMMFR